MLYKYMSYNQLMDEITVISGAVHDEAAVAASLPESIGIKEAKINAQLSKLMKVAYYVAIVDHD